MHFKVINKLNKNKKSLLVISLLKHNRSNLKKKKHRKDN